MYLKIRPIKRKSKRIMSKESVFALFILLSTHPYTTRYSRKYPCWETLFSFLWIYWFQLQCYVYHFQNFNLKYAYIYSPPIFIQLEIQFSCRLSNDSDLRCLGREPITCPSTCNSFPTQDVKSHLITIFESKQYNI